MCFLVPSSLHKAPHRCSEGLTKLRCQGHEGRLIEHLHKAKPSSRHPAGSPARVCGPIALQVERALGLEALRRAGLVLTKPQ